MAIPRPLLIAVLGVALCGAAFVATGGAHDTGGAVNQTPVTAPAPTVHHAVKPAPGPKPVHRPNHKATHAAAPKAPAKPAVKPQTPAASKPAAPAKPSPS